MNSNLFMELLNRADFLIDGLKFNDANKIYFTLVNNIDSCNFTNSEKKYVAQNLDTLNRKLSLYLKIHSANISCSRNDLDSLYSHHLDLTDYYNYLSAQSNDSLLLEYAKNSYARYTDILTNKNMK